MGICMDEKTILNKAYAYARRLTNSLRAEQSESNVDLSNYITGTGVTSIVKLTQAEYDALTPVATTLYIIVG